MNKIIVLDEATANVDPGTDDLIRNIIQIKFSHCTVLTIARSFNSVVECDKVLVMGGGQVIEHEHPYILLQQKNSLFLKMVQQTEGSTAQSLTAVSAKAYAKRQNS